jgi:sulfite reductase (ferredoxin)
LNQWINKIVRGEGTGSVRNIENMKASLTPLMQLLPVEKDPEVYSDYGNDARFSAKTARGECAA